MVLLALNIIWNFASVFLFLFWFVLVLLALDLTGTYWDYCIVVFCVLFLFLFWISSVRFCLFCFGVFCGLSNFMFVGFFGLDVPLWPYGFRISVVA